MFTHIFWVGKKFRAKNKQKKNSSNQTKWEKKKKEKQT